MQEKSPEQEATSDDRRASGATEASLSGPSGLPTLTTALAPDEVVRRLTRRSKRGKLPGFESADAPPGSPSGARAFSVAAFGRPYDRRLIGVASPRGEGSVVTFETRLLRKLPAIMIGVLVFTIWPGVWMTDSLLATWFPSWYPKQFWVTCAWYLPLCLLAIPALWKQYKRSNAASHAHALEQIEGMGKELEATEG